MSKSLNIIGNILFAIFMIATVSAILHTIHIRMKGEEPSILGHKLYIVESGSISPTIRVGSLIIVKEALPSEINSGDIISFNVGENIVVTHRARVIINGGESIITRGDINESDDINPVNGRDLIGKVVFRLPLIVFIFKLFTTIHGLIILFLFL